MFEADTKMTDWLQWFAREEDWSDGTNGWFFLPDGRRAATSGKMAAATSEPAAEGQKPAELKGRMQKIPDRILEFMQLPGEQSLVLSQAAAKSILGECQHPGLKVCSKCDGEREVDHYCDCELCDAEFERCGNCDGTGKETEKPESRGMLFWGNLFDGNLAAYAMAHAPASATYRLEIIRLSLESPMLRISADSWMVVIAGLHRNKSSTYPPYQEVMAEQAVTP